MLCSFWSSINFNILWPSFSSVKDKSLGLVDLILTDIFTIVTIYFFNKFIQYHTFLVPYVLWICFATYLNLYIVIKN